jgi:hypothetical protein
MNAKQSKKLRRTIRFELRKSPILDQAVKTQIEFLVNENNFLKALNKQYAGIINHLRKELKQHEQSSVVNKDPQSEGPQTPELGEGTVNQVGSGAAQGQDSVNG